MANYRTTVILKTDIVDSTPRLSEQTQAEMGLQRRQHKHFIAETARTHQGSIFQEEGDAYLIEFPSVTDAVLAAIEMHQNLRSMQAGKGEKQRLAIRAVITVGDILHQGSDAMGMTMSLTARIEKLTPPDEIYLSHAAWLVLNKAEVQTSFVEEFNFKGFSEPEKVYKVNQKRGIRVIPDQCIVFADAKGFGKFFKSADMDGVETFLLEYDDLMNSICAEHGGVVRQVNGDLYFLTFADADETISAMVVLCRKWKSILERYSIGLSIGVHKGNLHVFRSYVFGEDLNVTMSLANLGVFFKSEGNEIFVAVSDKAKITTNNARKDVRFQELDDKLTADEIRQMALGEYHAYRLIVE